MNAARSLALFALLSVSSQLRATEPSDADSLEWMIGRWSRITHTTTGEVGVYLENLSEIRVFPWIDYARSPRQGRIDIAAEFRVHDPDGRIYQLPRVPWVSVLAEGVILHGLGYTAFRFEYRHTETNGVHWLHLTEQHQETNSIAIVFRRVDDDPGAPLAGSTLRDWAYRPNSDQLEADYRRKKRLSPLPAEK